MRLKYIDCIDGEKNKLCVEFNGNTGDLARSIEKLMVAVLEYDEYVEVSKAIGGDWIFSKEQFDGVKKVLEE